MNVMQSKQIKKWPSELIEAFERAVKLAKKSDELKTKQKYCLAAVGLRNDGTIVILKMAVDVVPLKIGIHFSLMQRLD